MQDSKTEDRSQEQDYKFSAIAYPDAENYDIQKVLDGLEYSFCEWYYILHDRDTDENGDLKKPHFHILVKKANPSRLGIVAKQLHLPDKDVRRVKSFKGAVQYLVHLNDPDKVQYDKGDIYCCDEKTMDTYFKGVSDEVVSKLIFDYICNSGVTSIKQLTNWCINSGYWSEYRRAFSLWNMILQENKAKY